MSIPISDFRESLRFLLCDFNAQEQTYSNADLDSAIRSSVRLSAVDGVVLTACRNQIKTPGGADPSPNQFALLALKTAEVLVSGNPDGYSYRTRAISEKFDGYTNQLETLRGRIYDLEAGTGFLTWQEWASFIHGVDGINRRVVETSLTGTPPVRDQAYPN